MIKTFSIGMSSVSTTSPIIQALRYRNKVLSLGSMYEVSDSHEKFPGSTPTEHSMPIWPSTDIMQFRIKNGLM